MPTDEFIVFYAWQSDSPKRENRNFIETALDSALKQLARAGTIESSPRMDKDTKDVPGIPDIANTILAKIQGADCFLCDVSFVGRTPPDDEGNEDIIPNPNVMIELGYALAELGWERIVLVLNDKTGLPEKLPFDLRNRRWPIVYSLDEGLVPDAQTKVKQQLAKRIKSAVEAIGKLPERQKRGTTEERLRALEDMVGRLSGNIAQYTTMANLVAGLQHVGSTSATPEPDAKLKTDSLRRNLAERVLAHRFENVPLREGMLLVAICPTTSPVPLPLFEVENEHTLRLELRPLYASGWDHRRYGDRFATFSKWGKEIDAATEITNDGNISATGHEVMTVGREFLHDQAPQDVLFIPSVAYEKSVIEAVTHYVKALKTLGAAGPWYVAVGLTNLKKTALYVEPRLAFGGRVFEGKEIMPPVVAIPDDSDIEDPQSAARALRPAFDYVWREHNYPQSLNYSESGDWVGH